MQQKKSPADGEKSSVTPKKKSGDGLTRPSTGGCAATTAIRLSTRHGRGHTTMKKRCPFQQGLPFIRNRQNSKGTISKAWSPLYRRQRRTSKHMMTACAAPARFMKAQWLILT